MLSLWWLLALVAFLTVGSLLAAALRWRRLRAEDVSEDSETAAAFTGGTGRVG